MSSFQLLFSPFELFALDKTTCSVDYLLNATPVILLALAVPCDVAVVLHDAGAAVLHVVARVAGEGGVADSQGICDGRASQLEC